MANTIKLKNSGTSSSSPSSLEHGELAINYNDGYLFYKDNNGDIQYFVSDTGPSTPTASSDRDVLQWMGI